MTTTVHGIYVWQRNAIVACIALALAGAALLPRPDICLGLALGMAFGLYNFWHLARKMEKMDRGFLSGKGRPRLGTGMRFLAGIAAAAIALAYPERFHLISAVAGLMIPYALLIIGGATGYPAPRRHTKER